MADRMVPVELDDEPDDSRAPDADGSGRVEGAPRAAEPGGRRLRLVLFGTVGVLAALVLVGMLVGAQARQEAAFRALPSVLDPVTTTLAERWRWTTGARVAGYVRGEESSQVRAVGDTVVARIADARRGGGVSSSRYVGLDAATGVERWRYPSGSESARGRGRCTWPTGPTTGEPQAPEGAWWGACVTQRVAGVHRVEALDAATGARGIRIDVDAELIAATAWDEDLVVASILRNRLVVTLYDADGQVRWTLDEEDGGATLVHNPRVRVIDERIVVDQARKALVLDRSGTVLRRWQDLRETIVTRGPSAAVVTLDPLDDGGFVAGVVDGIAGTVPVRIVDANGEVVLETDGSRLWPVLDDGSVPNLVFTTGANRSLDVWDVKARALAWRDPGSAAAIVVMNGTVYLATGQSLFAVEARTGTYLWQAPLGADAALGGLSSDGRRLVVAGSASTGALTLTTVERETGRVVRVQPVAPAAQEVAAWQIGFGGGGLLVITERAVRMFTGPAADG